MNGALCVGLVLVVAGCGGGDQKPLIAASKAAVVRGSLTPDVHLFAEPVVAQVEVIVNRDKVDPANVHVRSNFEPYEVIGGTRTEREDIGRFTRLRYSMTLRCLNQHCVPRTAAGETTVSQLPGLPQILPGQQRDEKVKYQFAPAVVIVEAETKDKTLGRVVWRPLRSLSRVNWYDSNVVGQGFPFVANVTALPEPEYRVSPTLLGIALLAMAVALVALPAVLLERSRRRHREPETEAAAPALSPLERALALVEWASRRPSVNEKREALEALAFELHRDPRATRAREQGWSPPSPEPEEMTSFVASIRESDAPQT